MFAVDDEMVERHVRSESQVLLDSRLEAFVRKMIRPFAAVKHRNQRSFFSPSSHPVVHTGRDIINWLLRNTDAKDIDQAEYLASVLLRLGFIYRMDAQNTCESNDDDDAYDKYSTNHNGRKKRSNSFKSTLKADGDTYRFQDPKYWPSARGTPTEADYAIYLLKKSSSSKGRQRLSDKEGICLDSMAYSFGATWDMIVTVGEEEYRLFKQLKKVDRVVQEKEETAYWRIHRPNGPPTDLCDAGERKFNYKRDTIDKGKLLSSIEQVRAEITTMKRRIQARHVGTSVSGTSLINCVETYQPFDILINPESGNSKDPTAAPKNRWIDEEDFSRMRMTTLRIRKWMVSLHELLQDKDGRRHFEAFLEKEFSSENLKFWTSCEELKYGPSSKVNARVAMIYKDFLVAGARYEVNIDSIAMATTKRNIMKPTRYSYDEAQKQVFSLMSRDSYLRFMKSPEYNRLLEDASLLDMPSTPPHNRKTPLSKSSISVFFTSRSPRLSLRGTSSTRGSGEPRAHENRLRKGESSPDALHRTKTQLSQMGKSLSMTDLPRVDDEAGKETPPAGFGSRLRRLTRRGATPSPRRSPPSSRTDEGEATTPDGQQTPTKNHDGHGVTHFIRGSLKKSKRSASFADILVTKLTHVQTIQENETLTTELDDWQWRRVPHDFS